MHKFIRLKARFRQFLNDKSGAFSVLLAAGLVTLVGAVAIATDAARGYMVKARLSQALDAAALAGGRNMFSLTRDDEIRMYFESNFPQDFMGATVTGPDIEVSEDYETVTLTASASINTTFMRVLGFETLDVSGLTEVTRQIQQLDVILAMDMSGSMAWSAGVVPKYSAAVAILDAVDEGRLNATAAVDDHGVGQCHTHQGRLASAESHA